MTQSLPSTVLAPTDSLRLTTNQPLPPVVAPDPATATTAGPATPEKTVSSWRTVALIFVFSAVLALGTFALDGRSGLNLADEGYLRYGVHAIVAHGQVPMRDFQAYDPGRYYWAAGWSLLLGDGIVTTRLSSAIFQLISVGFALLALRRTGASWTVLVFTGLIVTFWMLERFKICDQCIPLLALYPAVRLIQQPDRRNALLAGAFVGLAAFWGRNHGLYCVVAFGALLGWSSWKQRRPELLKLFVPWLGGIVLGYLPMLLMLAFVPGFFAAFVESLHTLSRSKTSFLYIPVPWPWTLQAPTDLPMFFIVCAFVLSSFFVLLAAATAGMLAVLLRVSGSRLREQAGLIAAAAISIPYAHYAFSRADTPHLAYSITIMLVALLGLPTLLRDARVSRKAFAALASGLLVLTLLATIIYNPVVSWLARQGPERVEVTIGDQTINLDEDMGRLVAQLQRLADKGMAPDENILIAPYAPTLYEAVGRLSPLKDLYFLFPQAPEAERGMIHDLESKRVNWALLGTEGLDDMAERSLPHTYPLLVQYIRKNFQPVRNSPFRRPFILVHRIQPIPAGQP